MTEETKVEGVSGGPDFVRLQLSALRSDQTDEMVSGEITLSRESAQDLIDRLAKAIAS